MSEASSRWLDFARDDLRAARALAIEGIHRLACFHAQQSAEKALKHALTADGRGNGARRLVEVVETPFGIVPAWRRAGNDLNEPRLAALERDPPCEAFLPAPSPQNPVPSRQSPAPPMPGKMKIVWLCGLPDQARAQAFSDLGLPAGPAWSWVTAHLPPPPEIELHLVCPNRRVRENATRTWGGAQIHVIKVPRGGSYLMYRGWIPALKARVKELHPDVVHSWGTEGGFAVAALSAAPKNHVIGIQGILAVTWPYMPPRLELFLSVINERCALRKARRCVAESEYSRETVSRYTSARVDAVPHPLRKEFLEAEPGPRNEKIVLYLGVLARRKGFFDAVQAFLSRESDWKLVCIGAAASHKERMEVHSFLKTNRAGNRVFLTGTQNSEQIVEWFGKSPLFLLPSYTDTGPTALKEALAMGLWPVCYDNTGPKELAGRYKVGALVPTGNVTELGRVLHDHFSAEPWKANGALRDAVRSVRAELSPLPVWNRLIKLYRSYTATPPPTADGSNRQETDLSDDP